MKYILLFSYFFLFSCGYPDIDSVPNFQNLEMTKQESIDLCKLSRADSKKIEECLNNIKTD